MNILLVNPESPDTFWGFRNALKFINKKSYLPPLGLLTVAGILPPEWNKRLTDMNVSRLHDRDIQWADYVFISAMLIQQTSVDQVVKRCRKLGAKIVAGGPLFTSCPEEYLHLDHLVLKEAEVTLPSFIEDLQNGSPRKVYGTHDRPNLHETPTPAWELIDKRKYASMCIQYSRGCPFDCDFCDVTRLFGHRIRTKTSSQVVDELEALYVQGWRGRVFFVDDNFIGNKAILKKDVLPAVTAWMKQRRYPFVFNTQASINLADDDELMNQMVAAGFDCVFVGIESPNEESLSECNKAQNTNRNLLSCISQIQRAGMEVQAGFILGFDSDNAGVFETLIDFIQDSGVVTAMVGLLNAPRGTTLFRRLSGEQRLLRTPTGDNMDCSINFSPTMGMEKLLAGYQKVVETIYSQQNYCERILTFFNNYPSPKRGRRLQLPELRTFFRSAWHMGIRASGRRYYWKLMLWAMRRPRYLPLAVRLSIYGYHYRQITKSVQKRVQFLLNEQPALNLP
ncbi:MAG: B12-binding domain-containing radical SAM protein [Phycisphaerae bacterium]|nr:B12-binding domain-containing radical SAM protein [Phycisphaerae bacterium]